MRVEVIYCDNCGDVVWLRGPDGVQERKSHIDYSAVPYDVESANAGESATVCFVCDGLKREEREGE